MSDTATLPLGERLSAWRYAFLTTNPPERGVVDGVTRWLVVTRAGVLPLTLFSGLIALLLAAVATHPPGSHAARHGVDWLGLTLAIVGILVAHIANNMMNDLVDTESGNDTEDYPRAPTRNSDPGRPRHEAPARAAILAANVVDLRHQRRLPSGTRPIILVRAAGAGFVA